MLQQHKEEALKLYVDFHTHATKRGSFLYGNSLSGTEQVENLIFAKLVSLNSINFDFAECNFAERIMTIKDKRDGLSREGSSRVSLYKETGLVNCYTFECNYHNAKRLNYIPRRIDTRTNKLVPETPITDVRSEIYAGKEPPAYNVELFKDIGKGLGLGLLDYYGLNPISRVPMSIYKTLENLRKEIAITKVPNSTKRLKGKFAKKSKGSELIVTLVVKEKGENGIYEIKEEVLSAEENIQKDNHN